MSRDGVRKVAGFLVIVAAFALLTRLAREAPLAPPPLPATLAPDPAAPPTDFRLPDLAGRPRSAAEWRGRVVLLNFWATWCAPCREELPALEALHRALAAEDFAVVAVSLDRSDPELVAGFVARAGVSFPVLHDRERELADRLGVRVYPTSVLLDREGRAVLAVESAWDWSAASAEARLRDLLGARR